MYYDGNPIIIMNLLHMQHCLKFWSNQKILEHFFFRNGILKNCVHISMRNSSQYLYLYQKYRL